MIVIDLLFSSYQGFFTEDRVDSFGSDCLFAGWLRCGGSSESSEGEIASYKAW